MLALAYHVDSLIESGQLKSYGEAARKLGVSDARITQIVDLTLLAPRIQEAILEGQLTIDGKRAQKLTRYPKWTEQQRRVSRKSQYA